MKIVRRVTAGIHPEAEMTRYLTERGFTNCAPLYGELVRAGTDGTPHTLGLVQGFVRNQGDGWVWTLDFLARAVEEIAVTASEHEDAADVFGSYDAFASAIGRRLGELHAVLGMPTNDPDFAPSPANEVMLRQWAEARDRAMEGAFTVLRGRREWPDEETRKLAAALVEREDELKGAAFHLARSGRGAWARACMATSISARCWSYQETPISSTSRESRRGPSSSAA